MQPCQYICRQPDSPLNLPLCLGKWLPAHCKGVLSRIRLIIRQQGSEKVSVGDAPRVALQVQHVQVHTPVRCTAAWASSCSCDWPACGTGFACVRGHVRAVVCVGRGFPGDVTQQGLTLQEEKQWFIHLLHIFRYLLTGLQLFLPLPVQVIDYTNHCEISSSRHV